MMMMWMIMMMMDAGISQKPHVQTSRDFLCTLLVPVARSSSDDNATCLVLLVLWTTL